MKAILVGNGAKPPSSFREACHSAGLVVAVDGGAHHCAAFGILPHLLIGDFDSIRPEVFVELQRSTSVYKFPTEKNESDLLLGMREAHRRGASEILVFSAFDELLDYGLAALLDATNVAAKVNFVTTYGRLYVLGRHCSVAEFIGDNHRVSIFPLDRPIELKSQGLKWELNWGRNDHASFSLSNRAVGRVRIEIGCGSAFVQLDHALTGS